MAEFLMYLANMVEKNPLTHLLCGRTNFIAGSSHSINVILNLTNGGHHGKDLDNDQACWQGMAVGDVLPTDLHLTSQSAYPN